MKFKNFLAESLGQKLYMLAIHHDEVENALDMIDGIFIFDSIPKMAKAIIENSVLATGLDDQEKGTLLRATSLTSLAEALDDIEAGDHVDFWSQIQFKEVTVQNRIN